MRGILGVTRSLDKGSSRAFAYQELRDPCTGPGLCECTCMCGGTSLTRWAWTAKSIWNIWNGTCFRICTLEVPCLVSRMPEEFKKSWVVHTPALLGVSREYGSILYGFYRDYFPYSPLTTSKLMCTAVLCNMGCGFQSSQ